MTDVVAVFRSVCTVLAFLGWLVIGPSVPAQAGQERLDGRQVTQADIQPFADEDLVLWSDPERNQPLFLPVSLLESTPLEELPLDPIQKQILRSRLDSAPAIGESAACRDVLETTDLGGHQGTGAEGRPLVPGEKAGGADLDSTLLDLALNPERVTLEGTVIGVVTGWSPSYLQPSSLVFVETTKLLSDGPMTVGPGDVVSVLVPEGAFELQGKRVCSKAAKFLGTRRPVPERGETVRVEGYLDLVNASQVQHVRGGIRYPKGSDSAELREQAAEVSSRQGATSCAPMSPAGAWFPGTGQINVVYTPNFQQADPSALNKLGNGVDEWESRCPGNGIALPILGAPMPCPVDAFGVADCTKKPNTVTVHFAQGLGPDVCPGAVGGPCHPTALTDRDSQYLILYSQFKNQGGTIQTTNLSGPAVDNLIAHELGHVYGLGEGACTDSAAGVRGIMTLPIEDDSHVLSAECDRAKEINTGLCTQSSPVPAGAVGLLAPRTHCFPEDPVGDLPDLCDRVPELCRPRVPGGPMSPWWTIPETRPTCALVTTCEYTGCTTSRTCYFDKSALLARTLETNQGPATAVLSPAPGALVRGTVQIDGWSRDDDLGVTGTLGFWVDRLSVYPAAVSYGEPDSGACSGSTDPNCPNVGFSASLDTTLLVDGSHTLEVVTAEADPDLPTPGYVPTTFKVDNTLPSVSITAPAAGATVSGTVQVTVSASDANGISTVYFYVDGVYQTSDSSAPYVFSLNTANWTNGSHTLKARAWDKAGNGRTRQITVTFANDTQVPQVSLTQPGAGALLRGNVTVTAQATDDQGVSHVEFYVDGALLGTDATAPYQVTWSTTTAADGSHSLTARAFDGSGNAGVSAARTVTVDNTIPKMYVDVPSNNEAVAGTLVKVAGWAIDASGIVSRTFLLDSKPLQVNLFQIVNRSGACDKNPEIPDPDCPNVGWRVFFDSTAYPNGTHTVSVTVKDAAGNAKTVNRVFVINNPPVTVSFNPVADATAWQANPTYNDGSSTALAVRTTSDGSGAYAFLKFQVSGIDGPVTSARLLVKAFTSMSELYLYWLVHSNWSESNLTWSYFPDPGGYLDHTFNLYAGYWYTFDVSSFVTGDGTYSMGFASANPSYAYIYSRQSSYPPVLEVTYQP